MVKCSNGEIKKSIYLHQRKSESMTGSQDVKRKSGRCFNGWIVTNSAFGRKSDIHIKRHSTETIERKVNINCTEGCTYIIARSPTVNTTCDIWAWVSTVADIAIIYLPFVNRTARSYVHFPYTPFCSVLVTVIKFSKFSQISRSAQRVLLWNRR